MRQTLGRTLMALGGATGGEPTPARRRFAVAVWWHGRAGTPGMALGIALWLPLGWGLRSPRRPPPRRPKTPARQAVGQPMAPAISRRTTVHGVRRNCNAVWKAASAAGIRPGWDRACRTATKPRCRSGRRPRPAATPTVISARSSDRRSHRDVLLLLEAGERPLGPGHVGHGVFQIFRASPPRSKPGPWRRPPCWLPNS